MVRKNMESLIDLFFENLRKILIRRGEGDKLKNV